MIPARKREGGRSVIQIKESTTARAGRYRAGEPAEKKLKRKRGTAATMATWSPLAAKR